MTLNEADDTKNLAGLLGRQPKGDFESLMHAKVATLNTSGITPLAFKVLILPDPVEEVTKGGIIIPDEKRTKDEYATTSGTIVAVATAAFSHVSEDEWAGQKPKVGDHVVFTRYAGFRRKGADGVDYLIVKDEDIHAKL